MRIEMNSKSELHPSSAECYINMAYFWRVKIILIIFLIDIYLTQIYYTNSLFQWVNCFTPCELRSHNTIVNLKPIIEKLE